MIVLEGNVIAGMDVTYKSLPINATMCTCGEYLVLVELVDKQLRMWQFGIDKCISEVLSGKSMHTNPSMRRMFITQTDNLPDLTKDITIVSDQCVRRGGFADIWKGKLVDLLARITINYDLTCYMSLEKCLSRYSNADPTWSWTRHRIVRSET